jgi:hypothetical protein
MVGLLPAATPQALSCAAASLIARFLGGNTAPGPAAKEEESGPQ